MDYRCIEELLGLPEFNVVGVRKAQRQLMLDLLGKEKELACPKCGESCDQETERRVRKVRDLPVLGQPVELHVAVRRFRCRSCGKRPWERSSTFGPKQKWTHRLYNEVRQEFLAGCPSKELAKIYGLCQRTIFRWSFERSHGGRPRKLGKAIGIDEYARQKGHNYNTIVVDLDKRRPVTTFKGRTTEDVISWFRSRPKEELAKVEVVVIDMSKPYAAAIKELFTPSVLVIDRFHVVKNAVDALEEVLRAIKRHLDRDGKKELKKIRKKWLASDDKLTLDEWRVKSEWLRRFPELKEVIDWIGDLRKWFERKYTKPARAALEKLIERARNSGTSALKRVSGTLTRWFEPILRYIQNPYTNGITEGFNNKIKLLQRMAFGLKNEHNRKKRILASCGRP